jgi:catechol 2,3-dioxygenase-like lactoylglutathione lyase family enzyme
MIDHIDHIVLTTRDLQACTRFYCEVLGMKLEKFKTPTEERLALKFGVAVPGSLDLCVIAAVSLEAVMANLKKQDIPILEGPVTKTGATGKIRSVYVRDPDLNLVEISVYNN